MSSVKYTPLMMADTNAIKLRAEENLAPPNEAQEIASPLTQSPDQEPFWANPHEIENRFPHKKQYKCLTTGAGYKSQQSSPHEPSLRNKP
jgi:hypothetical protein